MMVVVTMTISRVMAEAKATWQLLTKVSEWKFRVPGDMDNSYRKVADVKDMGGSTEGLGRMETKRRDG